MKTVAIILLNLIIISACAQLQPEPISSGVYRWADHPVKAREDREGRKIPEEREIFIFPIPGRCMALEMRV